MLENLKNSKSKGTAGVGSAIQYFTLKGLVISVPLNDSQSYDLIVDEDGKLKRVQIKTTASKSKFGTWTVHLRTTGGNQSFHTAKDFDKTASEYLFVLSNDGRRWLIPTDKIECKTSMNLGKEQFKEFEIVD
jgi:hypothetical protein